MSTEIKKGIENGEIKTFTELFRHTPQTTLASELGIPPDHFAKKIADPGQFTYKEMIRLAGHLQIDLDIIHRFITNQIHPE